MVVWGQQDFTAPPAYSATNTSVSPVIAVIGDTQRTSALERLLLFREQNEIEREHLVTNMLARNFEILVHLGDMVFDGSSEQEWQYFDSLFAPLRSPPRRTLIALGNHEYWGNNQRAMRNVTARFPELIISHWRDYVFHGVALLVIDSNVSEYTEAEWHNQIIWFENRLQELDQDEQVRAIVVFSHHPPFSNNTVTGEATHVQQDFLPAFFDTRKTVAFISGHAHGYERFAIRDKTFIVSGGGGGPRFQMLTEADSRHQDLYGGPQPRPFNYLLLALEENDMRVSVMGLHKGQDQVKLIEEFSVNYPTN